MENKLAVKTKTKPQKPAWHADEVKPLDIGKPHQHVKKPLVVVANKKININTNRIYHGDAVGVLSSFPDDYFDSCITDPPYNISQNLKGLSWAFSSHVTVVKEWDRFSVEGYNEFTSLWLNEIRRVTKPNGNIFIFGSYHNIYSIGAIAHKLNLRILNSIIWAKPNAQPNITCRMFTESTEQIIWICNNTKKKATKWTFNYHQMKEINEGKQMRNFWVIPITPLRERKHGKHPTQKPLKLMERLILAGSNLGDKIIDCFAGVGSTLLACDRLEREWVGIEQEEEYCQVAHKRLDEERKLRRKPMEIQASL